jgi:hypothetical protein
MGLKDTGSARHFHSSRVFFLFPPATIQVEDLEAARRAASSAKAAARRVCLVGSWRLWKVHSTVL